MAVGARSEDNVPNSVVDGVLEQVRSAIPQGLNTNLTLDTPLFEVGLDSLTTMDVVNRLEGLYQIRFSEEDLYDLETCGDLVELVASMLNDQALAASLPTEPVPTETQVDAELGAQLSAPREHWDVTQFPECAAFAQRLADSSQAGLVNPFFRVHEGLCDATALMDGRAVISYASFDYLGLARSRSVVEAASQAMSQFGTSASASRLVGGESSILVELDTELARFLGAESALVFPSGYGTNATLFAHLFGANDHILYDELAHNSIVQGAMLSQAKRRAFPHNDYQFVDELLEDTRARYRRVVVAVEGVYSMDGDYPALDKFLDVKRRHGALLYIDEAHSVGVLGATGRGICEQFDVEPRQGDLWMGTISKALGSGGGYIAGRRELVQYLKYTAPAFVFATAASPANTAAALAALRVIRNEPERVARLQERARLFLALARDHGLDTGNSGGTPIIPIILGDSARCVRVSHRLFEHGIDARPILYPAVPEKAARIRFFVTVNHTEQQIRRTVQALVECLAAD